MGSGAAFPWDHLAGPARLVNSGRRQGAAGGSTEDLRVDRQVTPPSFTGEAINYPALWATGLGWNSRWPLATGAPWRANSRGGVAWAR